MTFRENLFMAEKIPRKEIGDFQNGSPDLLLWAAPVMFLFVALEFVVSRITDKPQKVDKRYFNERCFNKKSTGRTAFTAGLLLH
jgi:hypothetical protein